MKPAAFLACALALVATQTAAQDWQAQLTSFIDDVTKCYEIIGLSASVVVDDRVAYAQGFGFRDRERQLRVDADTLFGIGSTTKSFTSALVAMLQQTGQLPLNVWDADIHTVLRSFRLNSSIADQQVTLRDMLAHKTGVPRNDYLWISYLRGLPDTQTESLRRIQYFPSSSPFRQVFKYNNWMFMAAGALLEQSSNLTWQQLVRQRVFAPLGMSRTQTSVDAAIGSGNYAAPYALTARNPNTWVPFPVDINRLIEPLCAAGCIASSARDMAQYLRFHLNRGVANGVPLVDAALLEATRAPEFATKAAPDVLRPVFPVEYAQWTTGLGWFQGTYRGYRFDTHGGGTLGHITQMTIFPMMGTRGVGFFGSSTGGLGANTALLLIEIVAADLAMGLRPWITSEYACSLVPGKKSNGTSTLSQSEIARLRQWISSLPSLRAAPVIPTLRSPSLDAVARVVAQISQLTPGGISSLHNKVDIASFAGVYENLGYGRAVFTVGPNNTLNFRLNDVTGVLTVDPQLPILWHLRVDEGPYRLLLGAAPISGTVFDLSGSYVVLMYLENESPPFFNRISS